MIITIEVPSSLTPQRVWQRLTDWPAHGNWIPLTRMIILNGEPGKPALGDSFIGRTGIGALHFDDRMTVTQFREPEPSRPTDTGFCEVTKSGRLIKGRAWFEVIPAEAGTKLIWVEEIKLPKAVDAVFGPLLKVIGARVFETSLAKALAN